MTARRAAAARGADRARGCANGCPRRRRRAKVVVGSKAFTESVILGRDGRRARPRGAGATVQHRRQLGGTEVVLRALEGGEIDVYPEYTGTLYEEILRGEAPGRTVAELRTRPRPPRAAHDRAARVRQQLRAGHDRGARRPRSASAASPTCSPTPSCASCSPTRCMARPDGWPGLRARYGLPQRPRGMDHDLAYRALAAGAADVIDIYSTDAEIRAYDLRVLEDDRHYFPAYAALFLYRAELADRAPAAVAALEQLEGRISAGAMIALNARAKLDHVAEAEVAANFLREAHLGAPTRRRRGTAGRTPWLAAPPSTPSWSSCRCWPPSRWRPARHPGRPTPAPRARAWWRRRAAADRCRRSRCWFC